MRLTSELSSRINQHLTWDKRRTSCLVQIIVALFAVQSVNLKKIACAFMGESSASRHSNYRRLQRFFSGAMFNYDHIAKVIFTLFRFDKINCYLILDRTNWQWGQSNLNILFLCIAYRGAAIPVYWLVLNKKGNSSTRERIALIQRFIRCFGVDCISGLLGDREFIGKAWFNYLDQAGIAYYFRVKKDADTTNRYGKSIAVHWLFHNLPPQCPRYIEAKRPIYGNQVFIAGMKLEQDYLIVVTNQDPANAIKVYAERWQIETLFGCLKSKGFNFEDTHLVRRTRIKKLIAVLALAFCYAHLVGEWSHRHEKTIKLKNHGRLEESYFRRGLDSIKEAIFKRGKTLNKICRIIGSCCQRHPQNNPLPGILA